MSVQLPLPFKDRIEKQLGKKAADFFNALENPKPVSIRLNQKKYAGPLSADRVLWSSNGYYLTERPSFTLDPLFHAGAYYVQEASSMFLEQAINRIINPDEAIKVLDLCASPGGKSTHLLSLLNNESLLISNEVINTRLGPLQENISKWGYSNVVTTNLDPKSFNSLQGYFDIVLIDAPCSGEGLFRKDPKAIQEWSEINAANCVLRQKRIIQDVLPCIKPGGYLVYSTCTYNPEENINQIDKIIREHDFKSIPIPLTPEWNITEASMNKALGYQFYPNNTRGEGFFLAIVQNQQCENRELKKCKSLKQYKGDIINANSYLEKPELFNLLEPFPNEICFLAENLIPEIEQLMGYLPVKKIGTKLGEIKGKDFIPHHDLALSNDKSGKIPCINLDKTNALQYLRRNQFDYNADQQAWHLAQYKGLGLGWVNITSGRANNKLPMNLRIRNL